jgi:NAD+ diphosphatase
MLHGLGFIGNPLNRATEVRDDAPRIAALRASAEARTILIVRDMPLLAKTDHGLRPLLPIGEIEALGGAEVEALLGLTPSGAPVFGALIGDDAVETRGDSSDGFFDKRVLVVPGRDDLKPVDLRTVAVSNLVPPAEAAILAEAKALLYWHARHRFCANCGAPSVPASAGWRRDCPSCKAQHFPRTDPVVIMLAVDGDHCLLGRQARFPKGMYSALAGFLEPGETIEEAVRREIHEEAGIACGEVAFFASQPWPFPASLMIGCFVNAASRDIHVDGLELEDARWFSRDEVQAMLEGRHPSGLLAPTPMAIAHHLLKQWAVGEAPAGAL